MSRGEIERVVADHVAACKRKGIPLTNVGIAFVQAVYR